VYQKDQNNTFQKAKRLKRFKNKIKDQSEFSVEDKGRKNNIILSKLYFRRTICKPNSFTTRLIWFGFDMEYELGD